MDTHTVSFDLSGVTANYGDDKIVVSGDSFTVDLTAGDELKVTVNMGGKDITDTAYANGTVTIHAVTADVTVTAESVHTPKNYRWEFDGTELVCVSGENALRDCQLEYLAVTECTHSYASVVTPPTCTEQGYTTYICHCGIIITMNYVDTTGHSWGQWVEMVAPSCKEDGVNTRMCTACNATETERINKNPFTDVKADRFEDAILWAYYEGITAGTGDGTAFSPEETCTRKQIVTFLWRNSSEEE